MKVLLEKVEDSDAPDRYEFSCPGRDFDLLRAFIAAVVRHDLSFMESSGQVVIHWKIDEE